MRRTYVLVESILIHVRLVLNASLILAQVSEYAKQIEGCGYDLYWGGLAQTDSHEFMLAPVKNRNKMKFFIRDSRCEMALVKE